jgi:hypothetical protein
MRGALKRERRNWKLENRNSKSEKRNSKSENRKSEKSVILSEAKNLRSCKVEKQLPRFFASLRMTDSKPSPSAER